ncbi:DNA polymerase [Arcanobacterium canis]
MASSDHALLSASGAHRWLNCPPSARLESGEPESTSAAAEQGTVAHALAEWKLRRTLHQAPGFKPESAWIDDEMETLTDDYVAFVQEHISIAQETCGDPQVLIEQRLDFSHIVPGGFGTGDCVIIAEPTLQIIDLKYGQGVLVEAERNPQLMLYALGALHTFGSLYDIETVSVTIYQPRRANVDTWEISVAELQQWAETEVKLKAELAAAGEGEFCSGSWCQFCKIAPTCRARAEANLQLARLEFAPPAELSDTEIADVLTRIPQLKTWASDVEAYALSKAVNQGVVFEGFKLVAGRTGRFAGRLVQVQNLPRNYLTDLDQPRTLVRTGNFDALELLYESVPDTLSQLIRTAFIPSTGHRFIVADFSAIEARVIAWLAGETTTLAPFREGKDLYCETASRMFGVPVEKHGINSELRQKGKIAVLACGYGGSVGALKAMGALTMGLAEHELKPIVDAWRQANPHIVGLWADVEEAAIAAITSRQPIRLRNLRFSIEAGILFIELPSGRRLAYVQPRLGENKWGGTSITYTGTTTARRWGQLETYGGKLVENIVQAIARDLLVTGMHAVAEAGHKIVMHVHDEIVIDEPADSGFTVDDACALMSTLPVWAKGLPLDADGYGCDYYRKD